MKQCESLVRVEYGGYVRRPMRIHGARYTSGYRSLRMACRSTAYVDVSYISVRNLLGFVIIIQAIYQCFSRHEGNWGRRFI